MRYFYDLEFLEDGRTIDLISIGIVTEDGRSYYAVNRDADWDAINGHPWLRGNVLPYLPGAYRDQGNGNDARWELDPTRAEVRPRDQIPREVEAFIGADGWDRDQHELWAYYGAYDHVALCQLWGRMIDLPECVPMYTNDLMQLVNSHRELRHVSLSAVVPQAGEHHALSDAKWNRDAHHWIGNKLKEIGS